MLIMEKKKSDEKPSKIKRKIHTYEIIAGIAFIILVVMISIYGFPKTDKQLEDEREEECISKNGIFYQGQCLTLAQIITWTNECESQELNPVFLRYDWGGEDKCYNQTFVDADISDSTQEEVVSCGNSGGIPVVTDEVLCINLNQSSDGIEYIE